MIFARFTFGMAVILALTMPAAAVAVNTERPSYAALGWQAYRAPVAYPYPLRILAPRVGIDGVYWSRGEQERVAPQK